MTTRRPARVKRVLDRNELGEELDLNCGSIARHHRRKSPPPHDKRGGVYRYDADEYRTWMHSEGLTGEVGNAGDDDAEMRAAKLKKEIQLGRRYELLADREAGRLIDVAFAREQIELMLSMLRARMLALPSSLGPQIVVADGTAAICELLDREIRDLLTRTAKELEAAVERGQVAERAGGQ